MDIHHVDWCTIYWNNNSFECASGGRLPALLVAVQPVPSLAYHSASVAVLCRLWWHNISSILLFIFFFSQKLFLLPAASLRKRRIGHGRHKLGLDTCIIINGQNLFLIFLAGRPWCLTHLEPAARAAAKHSWSFVIHHLILSPRDIFLAAKSFPIPTFGDLYRNCVKNSVKNSNVLDFICIGTKWNLAGELFISFLRPGRINHSQNKRQQNHQLENAKHPQSAKQLAPVQQCAAFHLRPNRNPFCAAFFGSSSLFLLN